MFAPEHMKTLLDLFCKLKFSFFYLCPTIDYIYTYGDSETDTTLYIAHKPGLE